MALDDSLRSRLRRAVTTPRVPRVVGGDLRSRPLPPGSPAPAISGVSPNGSPVGVETNVANLRLVFLTAECKECQESWRRLSAEPSAATIVVTPGPETESSRRIADMSRSKPPITAPGQPLRVVMSSATWHAYGVTKAPWRVEIEAGRVASSKPLE